MKNLVLDIARESTVLSRTFFDENADLVVKGATMLAQCLTAGGKILIFGNGGSAADAQHIAAEFVNRFALERPPLAAIALTTDTSILTSIGNDYSYEQVFIKQVQALGKRGDVAWGISTSGTSSNVLAALDAAREAGMMTLLEAGQGGQALADKYDLVYCVNSRTTARVQETHCILFPYFVRAYGADFVSGRTGGLEKVSEPYKIIDNSGIQTTPLSDRKSKVSLADFGKPWTPGGSLFDFLDTLPNFLAASDLKTVIHAVVEALKNKRPVMWAMGAHVIKVGLNPILIDLMEKGVIRSISTNGAAIIHDSEIALAGKTSEFVDQSLGSGGFGMARETADFLSKAIKTTHAKGMGLGQAVGEAILEEGLPHAQHSIFAAGARLGVPMTVHVAMGTDIIHMHPDFDARAAGAATHRDFLVFAQMVSGLSRGVFLNVGSAVVMPEVFLKALSLARNLGHEVQGFTTVNMDFMRHYRPTVNVVNRPTAEGGQGIHLTGHHEIMVPLLAAGVLEGIGNPG